MPFSEAVKAKVMEVFKKLDTNGNGTIELEEHLAFEKKCAERFEIDYNEEEKKKEFNDSDTNKDGTLSFEEFFASLDKVVPDFVPEEAVMKYVEECLQSL
eukprot:CAMPEP_0181326742 /NCGR_PEP_ID=MMETSP1101-20121128/21683_1 /TAXON_ID=46948 /ORGANISM="Rhodomonas abbreviata, Strain Caron Lab Isolate" /LENGTH=99 /DNA_ID=CAMNT_0023435261 /DNA_START=55 /DNA_END=354 /DNA_ORIENTATION=+